MRVHKVAITQVLLHILQIHDDLGALILEAFLQVIVVHEVVVGKNF
jgi:hypothetical protein